MIAPLHERGRNQFIILPKKPIAPTRLVVDPDIPPKVPATRDTRRCENPIAF